MKLRIKKDLLSRLLYRIYETDARILKSIALNKLLSLSFRLQALKLLKNLPSITKIRNICQITGRTRGVITNYGVSRIVFRQLADSGKIPGLRRASW